MKKLDLAVQLGLCCGGAMGMTLLTFGFMVYLNYWNLPSTSILCILHAIKFELVYSESSLNMLDLTLHLKGTQSALRPRYPGH